MDSQEQITIPNQPATLEAILQAITNLTNQVTDLTKQVADLSNRVTSLENETRTRFESVEARLISVEIKLDNLEGQVAEAASASWKAVAIAKFMSAEVRALREEFASHGREIDELKAA